MRYEDVKMQDSFTAESVAGDPDTRATDSCASGPSYYSHAPERRAFVECTNTRIGDSHSRLADSISARIAQSARTPVGGVVAEDSDAWFGDSCSRHSIRHSHASRTSRHTELAELSSRLIKSEHVFASGCDRMLTCRR